MRVLFVSTTTVGGSGRSQRELAKRLAAMGHDVRFLVDGDRPARLRRWSYNHLTDLAVRTRKTPLGKIVRRIERQPGRKPNHLEIDGQTHVDSFAPENALPAILDAFRPDVVIGNSVLRMSWRKIRDLCRSRNITTLLYVREVETLCHFDSDPSPADGYVANSMSLASQVMQLGHPCAFFPSVIETCVTEVASTRDRALVVNPIPSRGVDLVWRMARRLPEIPFVIQESWPLSPDDVATIEGQLALHPNVEFRRAEAPGPRLYRDARVLLAPYRIDNRPRVIAEAQANGIPVIAGDWPSLIEAVGPGGAIVPLDNVERWAEEITSLWMDDGRYAALCAAALEHSKRSALSAEDVATGFETYLRSLVSSAD